MVPDDSSHSAFGVLATVTAPAGSFLLSRLLDLDHEDRVVFERVVPTGAASVPFYVTGSRTSTVVASLEDHDAVEAVVRITGDAARAFYSLYWDPSADALFRFFVDNPATILRVEGSATEWDFEIRFQNAEDLRTFEDHCRSEGIGVQVTRVSEPVRSGDEPEYGLTDVQRETLALAVDRGYYDQPRQVTTADLAAELGISDQALVGRLRRGIVALVDHTLLSAREDE